MYVGSHIGTCPFLQGRLATAHVLRSVKINLKFHLILAGETKQDKQMSRRGRRYTGLGGLNEQPLKGREWQELVFTYPGFYSFCITWVHCNLIYSILKNQSLLSFTLKSTVVQYNRASPVAQMVKNLPARQETRVWSLCQEDPLEKGMATHSSLAWRIPWTEEPGRL